MIALREVWLSDPDSAKKVYLLRNLSCAFPGKRHACIFMPQGPHCGLFLRLLCGTLEPEFGDAWRDVRVSWPIGVNPGFHPGLTVRENLHFLARLYGEDLGEIVDYVEALAKLPKMDARFGELDSAAKRRLFYAAGLAVPFDVYIANDLDYNDIMPGWNRRVEERMRTAPFIVVARSAKRLARFADEIMVFDDGRLWQLNSLDDGEKYITTLMKKQTAK